jgi:hypothetical protein
VEKRCTAHRHTHAVQGHRAAYLLEVHPAHDAKLHVTVTMALAAARLAAGRMHVVRGHQEVEQSRVELLQDVRATAHRDVRPCGWVGEYSAVHAAAGSEADRAVWVAATWHAPQVEAERSVNTAQITAVSISKVLQRLP